jgi:hypothetical protein
VLIELLVLLRGLIAFSIIIVAYLIRVNRVSGLPQFNAVGQLILILVGILELTSISWGIVIKELFLKKCWSLFRKHLQHLKSIRRF